MPEDRRRPAPSGAAGAATANRPPLEVGAAGRNAAIGETKNAGTAEAIPARLHFSIKEKGKEVIAGP